MTPSTYAKVQKQIVTAPGYDSCGPKFCFSCKATRADLDPWLWEYSSESRLELEDTDHRTFLLFVLEAQR